MIAEYLVSMFGGHSLAPFLIGQSFPPTAVTSLVHLFHLWLGNAKKVGYNYEPVYAKRYEEPGIETRLLR